MAIEGFVYDGTGQPLDGRTVRAYRDDTGVLLGSGVTGVGGEPNSKLHLPLSSDFADVSSTGATATANGGLVIDSHWTVNGLPTARFDAAGKTITIPSNPAFEIGAGDFTLDFSVFIQTGTFAVSPYQHVLTMGGFSMRLDNGMTYSYINDVYSPGEAYTPVFDTGSHFRLKRTSGNVEVFYNGVKRGSTWNNPASISADNITIGSGTWGRFHGGLSHLRLVVGEALPGGGEIAPLPYVGIPGKYTINTAYTGAKHVIEVTPPGTPLRIHRSGT
jgi:hypothetical protein